MTISTAGGSVCSSDLRVFEKRQARAKFSTVVHEVAVRSSESNPFLPGFGAVPEVWAGRETVLNQYERDRRDRLAGRYTRGTVLIGPSGVGKSVLVNRVAAESAKRGDLVLDAVRVAKRSDPIAQFASVIASAERTLATDGLIDSIERLLARLRVISVKGVQLSVEKEGLSNPHLLVRDSLITIGKHLAEENTNRKPRDQRVLVIRIDELQNADETQRSALLAALGDVLEYQFSIDIRDGAGSQVDVYLPVLVYLTGLPELINRSTDVDTFRRRFTTTPLGMLSDGEIIDALTHTPFPDGIQVAPSAARYFANVVAGDPFLLQLVGHHAWDAGTTSVIDIDDVVAADKETYPDRLRVVESAAADIPEGEWIVLDAIYELADRELNTSGKAVAEHLGKTPAQIASAAQRLERRATIAREWGTWRITNRLLFRYRTTGDVLAPD